ncbi:MAG: Modifier protein of major autolysin LytC [candidate division WS6 bacterium GW2011_GWF2_39_15]|uniref:Modifier protein of major autolysin LytC n=1 Tax=candidate division WS6 bacterium GW2011_GWF2_39_15 TaxID=1619100 RepID=A0A0G0MSW9_9BACT|nr:MAG: Modifier protein of major autolysin LytC [candidate division WS6 bacterium GW2011_GWF2_39_15]
MARRNNEKNESKPMSEKIVVETEERSIWSVFAGMVMVFLGIMLVIVGIIALLLYRVDPKLDKTLPVPALTVLPANTSAHALTIRGSVEKEIKRVAVYVNDKEVENAVWVDNGNFKYEYQIDKEGNYKLQVASISGFPIRKVSEKSAVMAVNVDWTAPAKDVAVGYKKEVDTKTLSVTGKTEAFATVVVYNNDAKYIGKADKDGKFSVSVPLAMGQNNFDIEVRDEAGNSVKLDQPIVATRVSGSINGNGSTTGPDLPESAGELEAAMAFLAGNKLMSTFGLLALIVLLANGSLVALKMRKYSV